MTAFTADADVKGWSFHRTPGAAHFPVRDDGSDAEVGNVEQFPADCAACSVCGRPCYLRGPDGKARHRIDCARGQG